MKLILVCFLSLSPFLSFGQSKAKEFYNNLCNYKSDGLGKSLSIKLKISIPCEWKSLEGERPHILRKFTYDVDSENTIMNTILIRKMPYKPEKADIDDFFKSSSIKEMRSNVDSFFSTRAFKVDGIQCAEILYYQKSETVMAVFHIYVQEYLLLFEDKLISITYSTGSTESRKAKKLMTEYSILFKGLINSLIILNQWNK